MYSVFQSNRKKKIAVNVGTIGHVDFSKAQLWSPAKTTETRNKSDRKRNRANRWR